MRARLALTVAGQQVVLREIVLKDKAPAFLTVSPTATVPCLQTDDAIIDESLDVMIWALSRNDPARWMDMPDAGWNWITRADGPFKDALDRTKYANRYPDTDATEHRALASQFLTELDAQITAWIFENPTIADYAILPFVRQFAFIDKAWFDAQPWPNLQNWLRRFLASDLFDAIMTKHPRWVDGDDPTLFP